MLKLEGIQYREIDALSSEGIDNILRYNTSSIPVIIDVKEGKCYNLSAFNEFIRNR